MTSDALIRAGAPDDWAVADKSSRTGGIRSDVAILTAPGRAPIVLTVFTERNDPDAEYDDEMVARVAEGRWGLPAINQCQPKSLIPRVVQHRVPAGPLPLWQ